MSRSICIEEALEVVIGDENSESERLRLSAIVIFVGCEEVFL